jgi:hypothetical protein
MRGSTARAVPRRDRERVDPQHDRAWTRRERVDQQHGVSGTATRPGAIDRQHDERYCEAIGSESIGSTTEEQRTSQ